MAVRSDIDAAKNRGAGRAAPDPVDVHVGKQMRRRRSLLGMTQSELGRALGNVSFQQVQKYERGTNRIAASRLHQLAHALGVGVAYFFDGLTDADGTTLRRGEIARRHREGKPDDLMMRRETIELTRHYYGIANLGVRRHFYELIKALARLRHRE